MERRAPECCRLYTSTPAMTAPTAVEMRKGTMYVLLTRGSQITTAELTLAMGQIRTDNVLQLHD